MEQAQRNLGTRHSVFVSYAHEDEPLRQQLEAHLSLLRRQGLLADWYDHQILPGQDWACSIDEHLETASLILLLISPDFLVSEYCYSIEMQQALERQQNGEAQVIPILLRPVDWESAPFAHLQCLPRDARAITEWDNRDAAFREIARGIRSAIQQLPPTSTPSQSTPTTSRARATTSTRTHTMPPDRNRQRMLKRVHTTWIAGVLEQSLHGAALMELGLEEKTDVLDNPWRLLLQEVDRPTQPLPTGTHITEVYNETESGLLILGEPGAGKTTLLLELARDLLDRARTDENTPIPVVFNLSSWAKKRPALSNWLVEELSIRYEVPRRLGQSWVNEDQLLLLLDGLDEVAPEARKDCIEAINTYRQTHPDVQIVVCCRITEYLNEPTQLRLQTAVQIQPLTQEQIDTYLESAGEQAEVLREALRQDKDLRELATTPLMLTILLFAYKGTSPDEISQLTTIEAKRDRIFALYVQHMLKRRGASKRYTPEQTTHWLSYLAQQMKRQNQTVFYLEQMQPDWLLKGWQRYMYRVLAGGIVGGLLGGWIGAAIGALFSSIHIGSFLVFASYTPIPWLAIAIGLVIGLIIGQIFGSLNGLLYIKSAQISTVETITWSWENVRLTAIVSIISGPVAALIVYHTISYITSFLRFSSSRDLFVGFFFNYTLFFNSLPFLIYWLFILFIINSLSFIIISLYIYKAPNDQILIMSKQRIWYVIRRGAVVGIFMACISLTLLLLTDATTYPVGIDIYLVAVGCVSGLILALTYGGVSHRQLETRTSVKPNQGIWRSLYNGGRISLIAGFVVWFIYNLSILLTYLSNQFFTSIILYLSNQSFTGAIAGVSIGLFFGLLNGGVACIKHLLLRLFLWRANALPGNYVRFLDYATERILLRKVGGGYIFVHRLLLEHFASLAALFPEGTSTIAAISDAPSVLSSVPLANTVFRGEKASLPVSKQKTGFNKEKRIAALLLILLFLEFSCGISIFTTVQQSVQKSDNATATAQIQADNATATAQIQAYEATATAVPQANATAQYLANALPVVYPPKNMSPVLDDPLQDNSKGNNWEVDKPNEGNCRFTNRTYDINADQWQMCVASARDFTNFIYEIQMTVVRNSEEGIAFRIDPNSHYEFVINQDGSYAVYAETDDTLMLAGGSSSAIHRGLNQTNLIAAVVRGKIIELYVNHQRVTVVDGGSISTHGWIGVIVDSFDDNPTEVIFQNAKVWQL